MINKKYWANVCKIQEEQTQKGIKKYGQILEENTKMTPEERIQYLEEELIDGLMYLEHIKENNYSGMSANEYQKLALRTASSKAMEDSIEMILNGSMGLCGESGEIADMIKKNRFQGHALDKDHIAKELGDVLWYAALLAKGLNMDLETVMKMNIEKLAKRYPEGHFSVERSLSRKE